MFKIATKKQKYLVLGGSLILINGLVFAITLSLIPKIQTAKASELTPPPTSTPDLNY